MKTPGPVFFAIKVATRSDGVTLYLSDVPDPVTSGRYKRERLTNAARHPTREHAEVHLRTFVETDAHVVELHAVREPGGDWRGWHQTGFGDRYTLHGPDGGRLAYAREGHTAGIDRKPVAPRPWAVFLADGRASVDNRGNPQMYKTALNARKVLMGRLSESVAA